MDLPRANHRKNQAPLPSWIDKKDITVMIQIRII